jgi:hypothetical protein
MAYCCGYEKDKGRQWLEHSAESNSLQDQAKAALVRATVYQNQDLGNSYNQSGINQTETAAFKQWSHGLPVVELGEYHDFKDGEGVVVQVLHGTTADFDAFDQSKSNIESDLGGGFYFTNTEDDVSSNYAGLGPDLTAKVQLLAERIASETDREYDDPEVIKQAQEEFMQHQGMTMPVFVRFDNPVVLGGSNPTFLHLFI